MKKALFFFATLAIAIVASLFLFYKYLGSLSPSPLQNEKEPSPTPFFTNENSFQIEFNQRTYRVASQIIENPKNLTLIANFQEKVRAKDVVDKNHCKSAVNGAFYTKSYEPLGLFVIEKTILADERKNQLTNGFFWVDEKGLANIKNASAENISKIPFIFQSGPIVRTGGTPIKLSIANDEPARRGLIGIDENARVIFLSIFDPNHPIDGPYLSEVPSLITQVEEKLNVSLTDVLNLDGGTASFFYSDKLTLSELALVGSIICEKQ